MVFYLTYVQYANNTLGPYSRTALHHTPLKRVLGQNGSGQNGTDKMVWTKWYTDKMVLDKMARTKWYGQTGTDMTLPIKSSINIINSTHIDNMIFSSILLPL